MKSLNKVKLIGWLAGNPVIITKKDGSFMAKLKLATDVYASQGGKEDKLITT